MLVLSRKKGEEILIGDDIRIAVVDMGDNRVRIGIEAPKDVKIMRTEVARRIKQSAENSVVEPK